MELLPYHKLGRGKYRSMGLEYNLFGLETPKKDQMEELENVVRELNLLVINY
jgi:pyruvate formate lyase activating enzyme